jgi:hypothetical protein
LVLVSEEDLDLEHVMRTKRMMEKVTEKEIEV